METLVTYILILTLYSPNGTTIEAQTVTSKKSCLRVGKVWLRSMNRMKSIRVDRRASFVCSRI